MYAIWKCSRKNIFINGCAVHCECAHNTYFEQFSVSISLGRGTRGKWRPAALLHENPGETVHCPDEGIFWVLPCIVLSCFWHLRLGGHFLLCSSHAARTSRLFKTLETFSCWYGIFDQSKHFHEQWKKNIFEHWESKFNSSEWKSSYFQLIAIELIAPATVDNVCIGCNLLQIMSGWYG